MAKQHIMENKSIILLILPYKEKYSLAFMYSSIFSLLQLLMCCAQSFQLCLTLCSPMDCRLPDSSLHGILQARILEWVAISFSRGSFRPRDQTCVSYISCIYHQRHLGSPLTFSVALDTFQVPTTCCQWLPHWPCRHRALPALQRVLQAMEGLQNLPSTMQLVYIPISFLTP